MAANWKRVRVKCKFCGWTSRRADPRSQCWRDRETPTCPKCGNHPVSYERVKEDGSATMETVAETAASLK